MAVVRSIAVVPSRMGQRCGVEDYARCLVAAFPGITSSVLTISLPDCRLQRATPLKLLDARRRIVRQVQAIPSIGLIHVHYADYSWNGIRVYEDLYDVFSRNCPRRLVMTVHEHPWFRNEHQWDKTTTMADAVFARLAGFRQIPQSFPLETLRRHVGIHVHHAWQRDVLTQNGVSESTIRVIPHFVCECVAQPDQVAAFKQRFGLAGKRVIVMAGFIFERKRYERILDLLPELPSDVVFCAIGGTNGAPSERYLATLIDRARGLGVSPRFVVTGYLPEAEMNAGLLAADLFAAPYGEVTSSGSIARCIGAGAPIVAGECRTFAELEADGAGMVVVDAANSDTLKDKIFVLLEDPRLNRELRQKNKSYSTRWSVLEVAERLQEWYGDCVGVAEPSGRGQ